MDNILYFAEGHPLILMLAEAMSRADNLNRHVRFATGGTGHDAWIKFKVGEGMWTGAFYVQRDPGK